MTAAPPVPAPGAGRPARGPLATASLVLGIVAGALGIIAGPVTLAVQVTAGAAVAGLVVGFGIPVLVLGVLALVLGLLSARGRRPRALEGAAVGLAAFVVIGQLVGVISLLVAYAI
jgi:hypothetical protein